MNKEKQIEEIAKILCGQTRGCEHCMFNYNTCFERKDAEEIYNAGYRKASEIFEEIEEGIKAAVAALQFENNPIHRQVKHETYSSLMRFIKSVEEKYTEEGK